MSEDPTLATPQKEDEQGVLDMLNPRAQARIEGQLRDSDALDAKSLGILGVTGAAIALMVVVRDAVNQWWWIPTAALGIAAVLLLAAIWPRTFDLGPDIRRFYEVMGGTTRIAASRQMLSELLAAIDQNDNSFPARDAYLKQDSRFSSSPSWVRS
jgi:hypothetical protein